MESAGKRNACRQFELLLDDSDAGRFGHGIHKRAQHPSCQDQAAPLPRRRSYENACSISLRIYNGFEPSEYAASKENILEIQFVKKRSVLNRCWRTLRNLASRVAALPMLLSTCARKLRSPSGRNVAMASIQPRSASPTAATLHEP